MQEERLRDDVAREKRYSVGGKLGGMWLATALKEGWLPTMFAVRYHRELIKHADALAAYIEGEQRGELHQEELLGMYFERGGSPMVKAAIERKLISLYRHIWFTGTTYVDVWLRGVVFYGGLHNYQLASSIAYIISRRAEACTVLYRGQEMVFSQPAASLEDMFNAVFHGRGVTLRACSAVPDRRVVIFDSGCEEASYPARFTAKVELSRYYDEELLPGGHGVMVKGCHPSLVESIFLHERVMKMV